MKTINVFIAGTGLVGKSLLAQIAGQQTALAAKGLDLRVVGLSNSQKMNFDPTGIPIANWQLSLTNGANADLSQVLGFMPQENSVFVDCTASDEPVRHYTALLQAGISLVVANKKGLSGTQDLYGAIMQQTTRCGGPKFFFEANVGAGLPVISPLQALLATGDAIQVVEAVLSGTLSFIFNSLSSETPFSAAVLAAKARGYTEPDPREDLSSLDAARKLLILARLAGLQLEIADIEVEPLLTPSLATAPTVESFLAQLPSLDHHFEALRAAAAAEGKALRYIASLDTATGKASIKLQTVGPSHPCHGLSGADNLISVTTSRYTTQPLVIRGPGAGAEVTAGAVLGDLLHFAGCI